MFLELVFLEAEERITKLTCNELLRTYARRIVATSSDESTTYDEESVYKVLIRPLSLSIIFEI